MKTFWCQVMLWTSPYLSAFFLLFFFLFFLHTINMISALLSITVWLLLKLSCLEYDLSLCSWFISVSSQEVQKIYQEVPTSFHKIDSLISPLLSYLAPWCWAFSFHKVSAWLHCQQRCCSEIENNNNIFCPDLKAYKIQVMVWSFGNWAVRKQLFDVLFAVLKKIFRNIFSIFLYILVGITP